MLGQSFDIRLLNNSDYDILVSWWKFWRFPAPPSDFLPENGTGGLMLSKGGIDIVCGFLYFTNSKIMWLEYIVSNPQYREKDRAEAIETLILELCEIGRNKGYKCVFTSVKNPSLIKRFSAVGFVGGSTKSVEMVLVN